MPRRSGRLARLGASISRAPLRPFNVDLNEEALFALLNRKP